MSDMTTDQQLRRTMKAIVDTAPEASDVLEPTLVPARPRRPASNVLVAAAAFVTVLLVGGLSMLLFAGNPESDVAGSGDSVVDPDITPAAGGFEFANPEHVRLRFTQELNLSCEGLETVDNGGFDSFEMDIWIDHTKGYARLGFDYPDGSSHDLILEGRPDAWQRAWGAGTDHGRSAGCREYLEEGGHNTSVAGWAYQDASELWFTPYLSPVTQRGDAVIFDNYRGEPTEATPIGDRTYLVENMHPSGTHHRFEYTLDETGHRVIGEERYVLVPDQWEASATIEVLKSGPEGLPPDIFDTSNFTPLWSTDEPVPVTTEATTP